MGVVARVEEDGRAGGVPPHLVPQPARDQHADPLADEPLDPRGVLVGHDAQ